ncbi:SpoIVB peptidase [Paenibacillus pasadenensis]|uniref:Stage IV sporulation protein B n=1 Tax=Paenibacillus pasadenensis TaxID=217090 RepID=A0A2N5N5C3_9BACL|nr:MULTISPECIES: SpoIVB peptidase [Paenibacillus]PLT45564.1 Stage IV sporulation protein B [Paenibacillus pasadenensis]QGG56024.1 SpoIVB peptidase [Paenibacillus sp. B01]
MNANQRKRWFGLVLVFFVCMIGISSPFQNYASFPNELRLFSGQMKRLDYHMPVHADMTVDSSILHVNGKAEHRQLLDLKKPISLEPRQTGQAVLSLKLFGKIPFKTVHVDVVPDLKVIPGGQTIGVKVKSAGVLVVGHHLVGEKGDAKVSPGEQAGLRLGDLIVEIDGRKVREVKEIARYTEIAGSRDRPLKLTVKRSGKLLNVKLKPSYDKEDSAWRIGLYIRDSAAGVGTLTFYAPDQGVYGALGHVITDLDTGTAIEVGDGQILESNVTSINKSQNGEPGEKRATFVNESHVLGNIERNTPFGIFGKMEQKPGHGYQAEAVPVAFSEEVHEGPAEILTVLNGQKVERFNVEISHVSKQKQPATKGMVIKVTDPKLLEKTGGIVQGMSGSPILQDGKLIGAVTHVFVNDPSSGYGCFIEWMLHDAGIILRTANKDLKAA